MQADETKAGQASAETGVDAGSGSGGAEAAGGGVRANTAGALSEDDRRRRDALREAMDAAHNPRSSETSRTRWIAYGGMAIMTLAVCIVSYLIEGLQGLLIGLFGCIVIIAVGGVPIFLAARTNPGDRRRAHEDVKAKAAALRAAHGKSSSVLGDGQLAGKAEGEEGEASSASPLGAGPVSGPMAAPAGDRPDAGERDRPA
jgi:predicted lipid-binding transport protein (Tim44 family)